MLTLLNWCTIRIRRHGLSISWRPLSDCCSQDSYLY